MANISQFFNYARDLKGGRGGSRGGRSGSGGFSNNGRGSSGAHYNNNGSSGGSGAPLQLFAKILIGVFAGLFGICALCACFRCRKKKPKKIIFKEDFPEVSKAEETMEPGLHVAPDVEKPTQAVEVADDVPEVLGTIVETSVDDLPKHGVYSEYNPYTSQATPVYSTKTKPPEPQIYIPK